ncbi:unnamed protein product [Angiostrongylus costaricensis]|uniref:Defective in cullin neddylation protein n=1 Tax=Angiostrongylus costaricensis TaxID=334426 RepID=A0A0R3PLE3_ANGCS|nr:unnamed protein product [Angiostrongylus costaricensis]
MNKLKSEQKTKIKNFVTWTQTSEQVAYACLSRANWNMEYAVDLFYQCLGISPIIISSDPRDDVGSGRIGPNGMLRLLNDLHLDASDRRVLILACKLKVFPETDSINFSERQLFLSSASNYLFISLIVLALCSLCPLQAQTQCEFSWEEWQQGLSALRVDSMDKLRERLQELDTELAEPAAFRELYSFTFTYGKLSSQLKEHGKAISRDTWNLLLDFCLTIRPDLTNYDDEGAWPVLIDQFVEYARGKLGLPQHEASVVTS